MTTPVGEAHADTSDGIVTSENHPSVLPEMEETVETNASQVEEEHLEENPLDLEHPVDRQEEK